MPRKFDIPKAPNASAGLIWLAILILGTGGAMAAFFHQNETDPDAMSKVLLVSTTAIIGAGICLIAASSRWWLKR